MVYQLPFLCKGVGIPSEAMHTNYERGPANVKMFNFFNELNCKPYKKSYWPIVTKNCSLIKTCKKYCCF